MADLKQILRRADISLRLVYLNVAVFVVIACVSVGFRLFNYRLGDALLWIELPASPYRLLRQPWTLVTYMFVHYDLLHLLFNMLWLYAFGRMFLDSFSAKHLRGLYVLGGLCGGLLYVVAYNVFPYFGPMVSTSYLVGASASVLAIVVAIAVRTPERVVRFFLLGGIRMKYLASIVIVLDLLLVTSSNAGGHIAHIGGALSGWAFAAGLNRGRDLTSWINRVIDFFTGLPSLPRRRRRQPKMKVHMGGSRRQADYDYNAERRARNAEIDRILEKLKANGYQSLTAEEKKALFDASKR